MSEFDEREIGEAHLVDIERECRDIDIEIQDERECPFVHNKIYLNIIYSDFEFESDGGYNEEEETDELAVQIENLFYEAEDVIKSSPDVVRNFKSSLQDGC